MMRKKAFTLIESLVYLGIFSLAGMLIATIFFYMNRTQRATTATYAVTGETDTAIQVIRRDLEETALGSIRLNAEPVHRTGRGPAGDAPAFLTSGASFCAARVPAGPDVDKLWISEYGVPRWTKNVFYAIRKKGNDPAELVRWEIPLAATANNRIPQSVELFPTVVNSTTERVVLHNLILPNATVRDVPNYKANAWGGFDIGFLRRKGGNGEDYKAYKNPNQETEAAAQLDATQLVDVKLAISQDLTGKTEFYSINFRVMPRY